MRNTYIYLTAVTLVSMTAAAQAQTISPASVTLKQSQVQLFSVQNAGKNHYSWSISPNSGSITAAGQYTAPASITATSKVTITASAPSVPVLTATVNLMPTVSISVTPSWISMTNGQSAAFSATISGASNNAITWTTPAVGSITAGGVYTVPMTLNAQQTITLTAKSVVDPTKTASATIALIPTISVTLSPTTTSLTAGQSTALNAGVNGTANTGINWSLSPQVGTLSNGVYTAPSPIASAQTVTVTAASQASTGTTASVNLSLVPVSLSVSPTTASLSAGQTATFTPAVSGTSNMGVTWSVSPAVGSVTNGMYSAPSTVTTAQSVTVTATSVADSSKTASAVVSLKASVVTISVSPTSASLTGGQSTTIKATVTGSSNTSVTWSMSPSVGTLSGGVYTAPATIASAQTITVKATSAADTTKTASATISLVPPAPAVTISVSPTSASLTGGQSTTISATVANTSNTSVTWSMSPSVGTLSGGVYTAPATIASAQTITVKATSAADSTKTASATISLVPPAPAVTISVTPTSASLQGGQSATFGATVTGSSNTSVNWSMAPSVGTISNGVYTAPSTINSQQTIIVAATSAADPTKIATAAIALIPAISVALVPSSTSLTASQTVQFNASLSGTSNPNVSWSMSPSVGSLSNGLYQAPATINSQQNVTVTAASLADPTKTGSATITLVSTVGIALTPSSTSLTGGQSTQFTASIGGTPSTAVTWSLTPSVGSVSNGVYTAPVTINTLQTIVLTVASIANPAQTATANITLNTSSTPTLSVSPSVVSLNASGTQQFTSSGLGTNPNWKVNPNIGSITSAGIYTAPSTITTQSITTITATNASDPTKYATAVVTLNPAASQTVPPPTTTTLPVEVMGTDGTQVPVSFNISSSANLTGTLQLYLQIHGLKYQTQGSVQINGGAWLPINDSTVTLQGLATKFGGIGGGFSTLKLTMNLPAGSVQTGTNTLTFQFNGTNGISSGFRVLEMNILDGSGNQLIASSNFTYDDPSTWQIPLNTPSDIQAGQTLWKTATLNVPGTGAIKATCGMCHTQDGRDLKYFNYSNLSIRSRAVFHGLTAQQGDQIASYIRSLNAPAPSTARPWNPPYQPGPGLDSNPVTDWAAGAGLDAVLDDDSQALPYLMPGGSTANWAPTGNLNTHEIPVFFQLLDWNRWLPTIHPVDGWGATFTSSALYNAYLGVSSELVPNDPASYHQVASDSLWPYWTTNLATLTTSLTPAKTSSSWTNATFIRKLHSIRLWTAVKLWEMNQQFGLEGMAKTVIGPSAPDRSWFTNVPFYTGPSVSGIPRGAPGIGNGLVITNIYESFMWYHLQLILDAGDGRIPVDWFYGIGYPTGDFTWDSQGSKPLVGTASLLMEWMIKGLQEDNNDDAAAPTQLVLFPTNPSSWSDISASQRSTIINAYVAAWFTKYQNLTQAQFNALSVARPVTTDPTKTRFGKDLIYALPQLRYQSVDMTLLNKIAAWAATIWPSYNWSADLNTSCSLHNLGQVECP